MTPSKKPLKTSQKMNKVKRQGSLFDRLKNGLEEGIQFARGELELRTINFLEPPPEWSPKEIKKLREKFGMSQAVFAQLLNVFPKILQSWEQGERKPSRAVLRLLQIMDARPEMVCEVVGVEQVKGRQKNKQHS